MATDNRIKVRTVEIVGGEFGHLPPPFAPANAVYNNFQEAHERALREAVLARKNGPGRVKVDFKVTWENDMTYSGTYEVYTNNDGSWQICETLYQHIWWFCAYNSGRFCPAGIPKHEHQYYLDLYVPQFKRDWFADLMDNYEIRPFEPSKELV